MIYQIKIALDYIRPPIWRRVQVSDDMTLAGLHDVVQVVMGWYNCHLHEFKVAGERYGSPMDDDWYDAPTDDESQVTLAELSLREKAKFRYVYDFGDDWRHTLTVEKIVPAKPGVVYPICLKGKRACPPEDCGGAWGYERVLKAQAQPNDPDNAQRLEWLGDFDPEAFDLDAVNARLQQRR